jgi:aquaporin NIP
MDAPLTNRLAAEVVGTFGFFFIGFSAIAAGLGSVAVAAGFGLGLVMMIFALGHISGGHFNPAVTLGLTAAGKFPRNEVVPYWVAQVVGGLLAAIGAAIAYTSKVNELLVTAPSSGVADWRALLLEGVATMLFLLVVVTVATDGRAPWNGVLAPLAIGGFIFTAAMVIGPATGGSFNPARSLAPALWATEFGSIWIYLVAPLAGALVAAGLRMYLTTEEAPAEVASPAGV